MIPPVELEDTSHRHQTVPAIAGAIRPRAQPCLNSSTRS